MTNQDRVNACTLALQQVLDEHNCAIDISVILRANAVTPIVSVIIKPPIVEAEENASQDQQD